MPDLPPDFDPATYMAEMQKLADEIVERDKRISGLEASVRRYEHERRFLNQAAAALTVLKDQGATRGVTVEMIRIPERFQRELRVEIPTKVVSFRLDEEEIRARANYDDHRRLDASVSDMAHSITEAVGAHIIRSMMAVLTRDIRPTTAYDTRP